MSKQQNSKFSFALTISIILHLILIAVLGYNAWQYVSPASNNSQGYSIDAIMVDPSIMTEQYQRQLKHQKERQQVKQNQQQQIEKQTQELQKKQLEEQQRLKETEKQRLLAIEKQKQEAKAAAQAEQEKQQALAEAAKAKAELIEQQKQALIAKQNAENDAKLQAQKELENRKRIEAERQKAEKEKQALAEAAKAKAEAEKQQKIAKQKALDEKQQQAVNDILGGLTSNTPKSQQGFSSGELNQFKSQIHNAISNKFINPNKLYSGKNCVLTIKIAPDGLLLSVKAVEGDEILCREAIAATNKAVFPKPKVNLYPHVKEMTIDFRPK